MALMFHGQEMDGSTSVLRWFMVVVVGWVVGWAVVVHTLKLG